MTDPLDVLRAPDTPIDPSPAFAADLRARLVRALATGEPPMPTTSAENGLRQGDVSYVVLGVPDAQRALAFYGPLLGWTGTPTEHGAQVQGCTPMLGLGDMGPDRGLLLSYRVDDVGAAVAAVRAGGGTASEPADRGYALEADCRDPAGLRFWLHQFGDEPETAAAQGFPVGGISYVSLLVPDGDAARAFYAAVLGWTYEDGNPAGTLPHLGLWSGEIGAPGHRSYGAVPAYTVADLAAAVTQVRSGGGSATEPEQRPYALQSLCTDDQGLEFYLHQY